MCNGTVYRGDLSLNQFASSSRQFKLLRPEDRLLVHCARTSLDRERKTLIGDLARGPIDWDYLAEIAWAHRVMPLLYRSLQLSCPQDVPGITLRNLQFQFLANAGRTHLLNQRLLSILREFDSHKIPVVPIKGPVLAAFAYGNISLRQFEDLDILVHKRHAIMAGSCVQALGYSDSFGLMPKFDTLQLRYQQHFSLISHSSDTLVDLHWTLEPGKTLTHFSDVTVWERMKTTSLDGVPVRNLSSEDLLLYLCVHGSNHCWHRLSWICDVAQLVGTCPNMNWEAVIEQAQLLQRQRMLFLGLALATDLLEASIPDEILKICRCYPGVEELARLTQKRIFSGTKDFLGFRSTFSFHLMARESV